MNATENFDPRRGRWIPWVFVGLMGLVVVVNGVMVIFALSTFTGITTPRPYDRGRTYNDVLEEAARQEALGWQPQVEFAGGQLRVRVRDAVGAPVQGRLAGVLQRPLARDALPLEFRPAGLGAWVAEVAPPLPGQWEARLILHGREGALEIRQRIMAP